MGHTYLRRLHSIVHPSGLGAGAEPYYTLTTLSSASRQDIKWWAAYLNLGEGRYACALNSATLVPTWGDGSGIGTGGTFEIPNGPLKMWKGKWNRMVYQFSSN